jgi:hypothetical protein
MKTILLAAAAAVAAAVLLVVAASPALSAQASCDKALEIRAAFQPRLDYEHERALRATDGEADWPAAILSDFYRIEGDGLDCRAIYDRYSAYVDGVISRNDDLERNSPKARGLIFKKW